MNGSNKVEKMASNKTRKAWNEDTTRKGDKRNKTRRDRTEKRGWVE